MSLSKPSPRLRHTATLVIVAALFAWTFVPFVTPAVKAVVPFPRLEDASYLEGTFDFEGRWPQVRVPRYFVVTAEGRREFRCGYLAARVACFVHPERFQGQPIRVWHSFWYGRLQQELAPRPGARPHPMDWPIQTYDEARVWYLAAESGSAHRFNPFGAVLLGAYLLWLGMAAYHRRAKAD